ncbi:MAG TPA: NCS2 family permease [Sedimentisphaerales bacterium]|nr:NCS2 family permease [Sedimentisphaerales bacterium]HRS09923.1 NCS2 family permease [Sedimentisphaerales bacterium]HRV46427.1 NCS2 family permease [Sedimentisphaerales bacterium]
MLRDYFELDKRRTNLRIEAVAGATTFLTMAYIIFTHPNILEPTGMDKTALIAVTCLISAVSTIAAGLVGNAPIAMAPGLGLNSIFALLVVSGKMDWQTALGVVFLSGLFFLLLTLVGLRKKIVEAIPISLISAIGVGIGLFITFIGLTDLGLVVANPITMVSAGPITPRVLIGLAGLLTMIFLESRNVRGSLLIGIAVSTLLAAATGQVTLPERVVSLDVNIRPVAFKLNVLGALKWSFMGSIFMLMFLDMFDSIGTLVACCHKADMLDEQGKIRGLDRLLGVDAAATMVGALLGTSTTTSFAESASGIEQGGRSGLTAVVTGVLFLVALLFIPLVAVVPKYATAPALIMVGLFMVKEVRRIEFGDLAEAFPSFIIIVMIALSYSISTGLAFGFVSFVVINLVSGRVRRIKPAMWVIAVLCIVFLTLDRLPGLIERLGELI